MPKVKLGYGIGDWIARKIKRAGYSQTDIAKKIGITQQALSQRIKRNHFTYDELRVIFTAVNVTDAEILKVMKGDL
jgi:transcriptional regulator with XRE-family HTH domain